MVFRARPLGRLRGSVDSYTLALDQVTVVTSEAVTLPVGVFARSVTLRAHAAARLVAGYYSPV